ncbi:hypothetical protein V1264_022700 [Littorina saxatilis]|uniref:Reelin domain-containing protein n=1 Tax=Littorina saxatilis TaxID=31220 RepID=A0AAN9B6E2_9CAEN
MTKLQCVHQGGSITQTGPTPKSSMTFQWTAPSDLSPGAQVNIVATIVKERVIFWTDVLPAEPLVYVVTPPDLPPVGGTSTSTTTNDPGGVLPTPGTAFPPTSPATTTVAPLGTQRKQDVTSPMTGNPGEKNQAVTSPMTGNPGEKNQVTDWLSMTCVSFLIAFLEVF